MRFKRGEFYIHPREGIIKITSIKSNGMVAYGRAKYYFKHREGARPDADVFAIGSYYSERLKKIKKDKVMVEMI